MPSFPGFDLFGNGLPFGGGSNTSGGFPGLPFGGGGSSSSPFNLLGGGGSGGIPGLPFGSGGDSSNPLGGLFGGSGGSSNPLGGLFGGSGGGSPLSGLSGGGGIAGAVGGILGGGKAVYGSKPEVPDLLGETNKAINASYSVIPSLTKLTDAYNTLSQEAMNKQFEQAAPGFAEYFKNRTQAQEDLLSGKYPAEVQKAMEDQVNRTGSAWNFSHGVAGTPFGVGRLSFERAGIPQQAFQTGLNSEQSWLSLAKARMAPGFNPGAFLVTPAQQFQRDWQQSLINAAPDPVARGQFDTGMTMMGMVLGAYSGGPGYHGTYQANYGNTNPYAQPANTYPVNAYNPNPGGYGDYGSAVAGVSGQPPPGSNDTGLAPWNYGGPNDYGTAGGGGGLSQLLKFF